MKPTSPSVFADAAAENHRRFGTRSHAEIKADFEAGIPLDMDGERRYPRRTPEAQADIAAARAVPTGDGWAGELAEQLDARTNGPPLDTALSNAALADTPAVREMGGPTRCGTGATVIRGSITASRVPSGNITLDTTHTIGGLLRSLDGRPHIEIERADLEDAIAALQVLAGVQLQPIRGETPPLPPDAIVLTGPEAERYRAIAAAARKAQASAATHRADAAALLQLFQAFCGEVAKSDQERDLARGAKTRPANLDKEP